MGKDILKFHAVIWPALLMAAGLELPRGEMIHGFVLKGGEKMSKTTGNVVDPFPFIAEYGIDALRYYLAREVRFGEDGTFTAEGFEARYSQELGNELGNLLNRVVSMIGRYRDGVVPADPGGDGELAAEVAAAVEATVAEYDRLDLSRAIEGDWRLVQRLNRLVEQRAPWTLAKDPARAVELDQTPLQPGRGPPGGGDPAVARDPRVVGAHPRRAGAGPRRGRRSRAPRGAAGRRGARVEPSGPLFPRIEEKVA